MATDQNINMMLVFLADGGLSSELAAPRLPIATILAKGNVSAARMPQKAVRAIAISNLHELQSVCEPHWHRLAARCNFPRQLRCPERAAIRGPAQPYLRMHYSPRSPPAHWGQIGVLPPSMR